MGAFEDLFAKANAEHNARSGSTEATAERIADAVELLAAITGLQFFENEGDSSHAAQKRFKRLVQEKAAAFCKRHGA